MAIVKNLLFRNIPFDNRLQITGSQSGDSVLYYTEATGDRHYYYKVGQRTLGRLESATFNSFMSFTQSGSDGPYLFNIIPMVEGNTAMMETKVLGVNETGDKGYIMKSFGGYIQNGSDVDVIGPSVDYDIKSDFSTASVTFIATTQSVYIRFLPEPGETIDWDVYIDYKKGFHDLVSGATPSEPEDDGGDSLTNTEDSTLKPIFPTDGPTAI